MADLNTHYVRSVPVLHLSRRRGTRCGILQLTHSGEPNTTGREPFEDSGRNTNVGSGGYTQQLSSGIGGAGTQGFDKSQGQGHGQGLTGADTGAGFGSTGENYKNVAPGAAHAHGVRLPSLSQPLLAAVCTSGQPAHSEVTLGATGSG